MAIISQIEIEIISSVKTGEYQYVKPSFRAIAIMEDGDSVKETSKELRQVVLDEVIKIEKEIKRRM